MRVGPNRVERRRIHGVAVVALVALATGSAAHAETPAAEPSQPTAAAEPSQPTAAAPAPAAAVQRKPRTSLDARWFIDGGMVQFVYIPGAATIGVTLGVPVPDEPRLFSPSEGGAERRSETIPNYQLGLIVGGMTLTLGMFDRDARWYHVKGMLQSITVTAMVTQLAKIGFGRHRPSFDAASSTTDDDRMSFFSGHASLTTTTTLYLGLYLRQHVFAPWRGDRAVVWWEVPAYAGLAALAAYVPYTRVDDHKHHVSDVLTGAGVGAGLALVFYTYQESRFRDAMGEVAITPWSDGAGASVSGRF